MWKVAPNAIEAQIGRDAPDVERIGELAGEMAASLDRFEAMLNGRDHLLGDEFSAADCAAYPFLKYALWRDPEARTLPRGACSPKGGDALHPGRCRTHSRAWERGSTPA